MWVAVEFYPRFLQITLELPKSDLLNQIVPKNTSR